MSLSKYKVYIIGEINYICDTEERAIALAEQDIKYMHPKFNLDIGGIREEE